MTTTSGLPASSISGRMPSRASAARKRALRDPVELGVRLGVGDRLGDGLDPPDLAGVGGHAQADRADPAVEVEEPLAGAEARVLARDRVEQLGRLGVGLQEGEGGDAELEPAEALAQVLLAERRRSVPRCSPDCAATTVCRSVGGSGISASEVTRRVWICPVRRPSRTIEVAQHPDAAVEAGSPREPSRGRRCGPRCSPPRRGGSRRRRRSRPSARGRGSRARERPRRAPPRTSTRACCGSATRRRRGRSPPAAGPRSRRADSSASRTCVGLVRELTLVGEPLPGGAGAGLAAVDAGVGDPVGRGLDQLDRPRPPRRSASTCRRGRGRGRPAGRPRRRRRSRRGAGDAAAALGERVDPQLELVARGGGVRRAASASAAGWLTRPSSQPG